MFLTSLLELVRFSLCVTAVRGFLQSDSYTNKQEDSTDEHDWCYQGCEYTSSRWQELPQSQCGGDRQSPINIDTSEVIADSSLGVFNFTNFSNPDSMKYLINTGHSVKCVLEENTVEIEGGGLSDKYSAVQFHFHSGDHLWHPGSEHLIDEDRYPMEMHIVSLKKGLSVDQALTVSEGISVLGFLINVTDEDETPEKWKNLTPYLINITENNSTVDIKDSISIDDLLGDVNLTKFYRYEGSLTTPPCSEVVVWTVFQDPIKISRNMVELFIRTLKSVKAYRPNQDLNGRKVYASPGILQSPGHSWCYSDHCEYSPADWHMLPGAECEGDRQSPINIDTQHVTYDESLNNFTFTNFSDLHTMKYLTNTGHTVKCVLEENMVEIEGGGLSHTYSTIQFHFHWGTIDDHSNGSEHTVDSKRYPMEMHIVSSRKEFSVDDAVKDSEGLAVLAFFIEATHEKMNQKSWETLTSYLSHIIKKDSSVEMSSHISIDDLLGDVDRSKYYRYNGSLTTPDCNEAVVWTVFKQPIKVNTELMKLFPSIMGYSDIYRPEQKLHNRTVRTSSAPTGPRPHPLPLLLPLLYVGCTWMGDKVASL
ncbi:carbonic anhydrase-like isoform X3 [Anguilla anguilla]|uniref:carbonic anhydrase-like isoform X3 n=1 Tax=Anguilla anguilla TaxID=7936 RepID=UPI0015B03A4B|nr:carbonic anhydrase-like isoform X3 [Anguilla anguilla]